jgi:hypothetical protein
LIWTLAACWARSGAGEAISATAIAATPQYNAFVFIAPSLTDHSALWWRIAVGSRPEGPLGPGPRVWFQFGIVTMLKLPVKPIRS